RAALSAPGSLLCGRGRSVPGGVFVDGEEDRERLAIGLCGPACELVQQLADLGCEHLLTLGPEADAETGGVHLLRVRERDLREERLDEDPAAVRPHRRTPGLARRE